jgi:glycosyltransferase involved in cell wall biosynthesis
MSERNKRRILLISLGGSMGGVETYLEGLAGILHPNAELFGLCVLAELATRLEQKGVKVTLIPAFNRLRPLRFIVASLVLFYMILRHRINVVQMNGFLESILIVPAKLLNTTTVYTRHGPFETELYTWYKQPFKYLPRMLSRWGLHLASRIVCVSETVGTLYQPLFRDVRVIPNWVSRMPEEREPVRDESRPIHILYVGRLERYKGMHLLLEAVRGMSNVKVIVLGDGAYRSELEKQAAGVNVEFAGFQRDTARFYNQTDIFVMPSLGPEGLPMVALEGMSYGLPCLFSDLPVHCEITGNGQAAMLFRAGDVADLREKLSELISSSSLREQYSRAAYRNIAAKYHVSAARRAYLQVFEVAG